MNYVAITQDYKKNREFNEKVREERGGLLLEVGRLRGCIAELKREEARQLTDNGVSKERVQRYLAIADRLRSAGIDLED